MKFMCTKENFVRALELVAPLTGKNPQLPILSHINIIVEGSKVDVVGTNLDVAIRATLRAKVESTGSFTVPAKTITDYVQLLPDGQVEVFFDTDGLVLTLGSSRTKIKGTSSDEFPVIPPVEEEHNYALLCEPFKEALMKTVIAVSRNEIRPELSGVNFGFFSDRYAGLILAATDSYRLAEKKVSVSQGSDVGACIVPARTVGEIIRLLSLSHAEEGESQVRLSLSAHRIAMRYDSFEMSARLIDGTYPDYAQIIPAKFKTTAVFPLDLMIREIRAASLFSGGLANAVSFDLNVSESSIGISSTGTQGEHSSTIDAELQGEENSILLNHRYVVEGLRQMEGDECEFHVNGGDAPCLFRSKGNLDYLYIVMPVRQ